MIIRRNKMAKVNHKIFSEIAASFADPKRVYVTEDNAGNMAIVIKSNICRLEITTGNAGVHVIAQVDVDIDIKTGNKRRIGSEYHYVFESDFKKAKSKHYIKQTELLFRYLIGEALCMPYTPEHRARSVPMDILPSEVNIYGKEHFWENYFVAEHSYGDVHKLDEWLELCCSEHRINARRIREDARVLEESYVFFCSNSPETYYPGICLISCQNCKNPCITID